MDAIRQLEEISINAWGATYTAVYDGWLLRYASGYTRRANSVQPLYPSQLPLPEKVRHCEQFYRLRELPTTFKLTAAAPPHLDTYLAENGYFATSHTAVQTLQMGPHQPTPTLQPDEVDIRPYPSAVWLDTFFEIDHVPPQSYTIARHMLTEQVPPTARFILVWDGNTPVGVARMVRQGEHVGLFNVVVRPTHRRQGYGRGLVQHILWLAWQAGAPNIYLQVTHQNQAALALYASFGFQTAHDYWYRVRRTSKN